MDKLLEKEFLRWAKWLILMSQWDMHSWDKNAEKKVTI